MKTGNGEENIGMVSIRAKEIYVSLQGKAEVKKLLAQ